VKRALAAALLVACADRTPPATVSLALPLPTATATATQVETHGAKPTIDDGDFSSDRGMVHLTAEPDGTIVGTFEDGGILTCTMERDALACRWYAHTAEGRATFRRKPDGRLEGTWGAGASDDDQGAWTLAPIARTSPLEGVWDTNWGHATIRATTGGVHVDYDAGLMDCEQRDRTLVCAWTESGSSGNAELTVESSHVLRGHWGSGKSTTDGGPWVFVRR
jgi:hypothetical protein